MNSQKTWDYTTDVLVVGSGGGGLTAALIAKDRGCDALVIEKGAFYGGSTAMSGGGIWIPNNHLMKKSGLEDSPEEALTYMKTITAGKVPEANLLAYIDAGAEMVKYLETHSCVRFMLVPGYSDYYPTIKGGKPGGGRTLEPQPFNAWRLGKMRGQVRPLPQQSRLFGRMMATACDAHRLMDTSIRGRMKATKLIVSYLANPARSLAKTDTRLTLGNALIGRLLRSLADKGVSMWLTTSAINLIVEGSRVIGLEAKRDGKTIRIRASRGVILAAGGFPHNQAMREKYMKPPTSAAWSAACTENTGDAIAMGIEIGAAVDLMDDAWWMPASVVPGEDTPIIIIIERSLPGSIVVNARGKRFTDEAGPYIDVVRDQCATHSPECGAIPAYMIMDKRFRSKYPTSPMLPRLTPKKYINNGYLKVADTLEELAKKCGIDPQGLVAEVTKFNQYARTGKDLDFGRGDSAIDRFYADPSVGPNPSLGPLDKPPYYAMEIWPGDIETKGGLVTDAQARVLRQDGSPIEGLYATGNCSASVMGNSYAGAGATIGPTMVFGYLAALHASGKLSRD